MTTAIIGKKGDADLIRVTQIYNVREDELDLAACWPPGFNYVDIGEHVN